MNKIEQVNLNDYINNLELSIKFLRQAYLQMCDNCEKQKLEYEQKLKFLNTIILTQKQRIAYLSTINVH